MHRTQFDHARFDLLPLQSRSQSPRCFVQLSLTKRIAASGNEIATPRNLIMPVFDHLSRETCAEHSVRKKAFGPLTGVARIPLVITILLKYIADSQNCSTYTMIIGIKPCLKWSLTRRRKQAVIAKGSCGRPTRGGRLPYVYERFQ